MNVFPNQPQVARLAFDENSFSVFLADGRILRVPLAYFPRLLHADKRQREHYRFSVGDRTRRHLDPSRQSVETEKDRHNDPREAARRAA